MASDRTDVLYGTLTFMILRTLASMGRLHGYGLARRIEQISGDQVALNQGTLYPALLKLQQMGWVTGKWGVSETGRRAKFYAITRTGLKQLEAETDNWARAAGIISRFMEDLP